MPADLSDNSYREFEHSGWERAAGSYANTFESISRQFVPALLDAAAVSTGCKLLDVACGAGVVSAAAASRGADVTGVDFSPSMLAEARKRHPSLTFREGDAESLPFPDGLFDAVVIGLGLHHFAFPGRAVSEARRVLRAGGRLALTTWAPPDAHVIHKIVVGAVRECGDVGAALPIAPEGAVNEIAACVRLFANAGFSADSVRAEIMTIHARIDSAQHLIDMLIAGTVRLSTMLRSQPPEKGAVITAAIDRGITPYREGDHFRLPFAVILCVGTK